MRLEGAATPEGLAPIEAALEAVSADPDTLAAFPRIFPVSGRNPG